VLTVLANTPDGDSEAGIEVTIFNEDIGGVRLQGDGVISVVYCPAAESNVIRINSVGTISLTSKLVYIPFPWFAVKTHIETAKCKADGLNISTVDVYILQ
jgi:hypothetical protein